MYAGPFSPFACPDACDRNYSDQVARQNAQGPGVEQFPSAVQSTVQSAINGDGSSASTPFEIDGDSDEEKASSAESDLTDLPEDTPLQTFLAASTLSTDAETQDAKEDKRVPKVTISTCHAAKGLEWPVVFLPASETGVYPAFQKSDAAEVAEERRLFYVAMTRGQAMLHMTHVSRRMERGKEDCHMYEKALIGFRRSNNRQIDDRVPSTVNEGQVTHPG